MTNKNIKPPKCRICKTDYRSYRGGKEFHPDCNCVEMEWKKRKRIKETYECCMIDKYFLVNDFQVHSKELKPYYDTLDWIGKENLFIYGNYGCHKTGQITAIGKKAMDNDFTVRYYRTSEIVYQRDLDIIKNVKLLILDNFGRDIKFEDKRNALFDLLDFRLHNFYSTVIITNELLKEKIDGALYDRFSMFKKIQISGGSTRGEI